LFVDMPPGTGDIQLTLAQRVPVSGAVIVTTPQDVALADARKALEMFQKVNVPILGVVENMSVHICSACGHEDPIFGSAGGERLGGEYDVPLLGQLPLDRSVRETTDSGTPSVVASPDGPTAARFRETALRVAGELAATGKDYSQLFPKITVEDTP
jgi:ATP-binding protein involved in chromosome partitioning